MLKKSWIPNLVALDIDGTLLSPGSVISQTVRDAINEVVKRGSQVVLATGRASFEIDSIVRDLGLSQGFAICSNGAVVAGIPDLLIHQTRTFDAKPVLEVIREHLPSALVAVEDPGRGYYVTGRFPDGELFGLQEKRSLEDLLYSPVVRVIIRDPKGTVEEFLTLTELLPLRGVEYSVGYRAWLDIGPAGISKGTALSELCSSLNVNPSNVLAIGDGRNDIEMIQWAGRGVVMDGAPPELLEIADGVTGSVDEDGVALELQRWFTSAYFDTSLA